MPYIESVTKRIKV